MATSKKLLVEQAMRRIKAGNPSVASNVHPKEIEKAIEQSINGMLRPRMFETIASGEGIPEGCVIVSYSGVPVTPYQDVSQCFLPAIPASLPKNMGVWHIAPSESVPDELPAPSLALNIISSSQENLFVGNVPGAKSYLVQQSLNGINWLTIGTASGLYTQKGLSAATKYFFRVMTIGDGKTGVNSGWSNIDGTTYAAAVALATPTLTLTVISATEIDASWPNNANASSWLLQRSPDNTNWTTVGTPGAGSTSDNDTSLTGSTPYYYRLKAIGDGVHYTDSGYGTASATTSTADSTPPSIVSASVEHTAPTNVVLVFNEALNPGSLALSKFTVRINFFAVSLASANASGSSVTVTLSSPVNTGDIVQLDYTAGTTGSRIADVAANFANSIVNQSVTNNV